jgi:hypothetical protein
LIINLFTGTYVFRSSEAWLQQVVSEKRVSSAAKKGELVAGTPVAGGAVTERVQELRRREEETRLHVLPHAARYYF